MKYQIYIIQNTVNQKRYIGTTSLTFMERYNGPMWWLSVTSRSLAADIMEFGKDKFIITENVEVFETERAAKKREKELFKIHNTQNAEFGYNLGEPGDFWEKSYFIKGKLDVFKSAEEIAKFQERFIKFHSLILSPYMEPERKEAFINENWKGEEFEEYQKQLKLFIDKYGEEEFRFFATAQVMGITVQSVKRMLKNVGYPGEG